MVRRNFQHFSKFGTNEVGEDPDELGPLLSAQQYPPRSTEMENHRSMGPFFIIWLIGG